MMQHADEKTAASFFRKWATTIAFVILVLAQVIAFDRIADQNNEIEALVNANGALIIDNQEQYCANRKESRESLRNIFFAILNQFNENDPTVVAIRELIEKDYPSIECDDGGKASEGQT